MKRNLFIILILLFLAVVCILEQVLVSQTLQSLNEKSLILFNISNNSENINSQNIVEKTHDLNEFWKENENLLCFFINHKDMQEMGIELNKMRTYSALNNKEEYMVSLNLVIYYTKTFNHIMGLSLQNLI